MQNTSDAVCSASASSDSSANLPSSAREMLKKAQSENTAETKVGVRVHVRTWRVSCRAWGKRERERGGGCLFGERSMSGRLHLGAVGSGVRAHSCRGGLLSNERTPKMATRSTSFQPGSSVVLSTVYSPANSITMMTTNAAMSVSEGWPCRVTRESANTARWTVRQRSVEHVCRSRKRCQAYDASRVKDARSR